MKIETHANPSPHCFLIRARARSRIVFHFNALILPGRGRHSTHAHAPQQVSPPTNQQEGREIEGECISQVVHSGSDMYFCISPYDSGGRARVVNCRCCRDSFGAYTQRTTRQMSTVCCAYRALHHAAPMNARARVRCFFARGEGGRHFGQLPGTSSAAAPCYGGPLFLECVLWLSPHNTTHPLHQNK